MPVDRQVHACDQLLIITHAQKMPHHPKQKSMQNMLHALAGRHKIKVATLSSTVNERLKVFM